jgi:hypothetical protein
MTNQKATKAEAEKNKCVCKTLLFSVGKERKGFYFFYLYTVLWHRFNVLQRNCIWNGGV